MNKRGLKWPSCPIFGKKFAKFVQIVNNTIDYYYPNTCKVQKFFEFLGGTEVIEAKLREMLKMPPLNVFLGVKWPFHSMP